MIRLKQVVGLAGLLIALIGVVFNSRLLIWVAIAMLGASILLRLIVKRRTPSAESSPPDEDSR